MKEVTELEERLREARKEQLFVNYLSPGTLFSESTLVEIETRDLPTQANAGKSIEQRHGAKPYGFLYEDGNGKPLSGVYYLTGDVIRRDEVDDNEENRTMRSNMSDPERCVIVDNANSYRFRGKFGPADKVVNWGGDVLRSGDDVDLVDYRNAQARAAEIETAKASIRSGKP